MENLLPIFLIIFAPLVGVYCFVKIWSGVFGADGMAQRASVGLHDFGKAAYLVCWFPAFLFLWSFSWLFMLTALGVVLGSVPAFFFAVYAVFTAHSIREQLFWLLASVGIGVFVIKVVLPTLEETFTSPVTRTMIGFVRRIILRK